MTTAKNKQPKHPKPNILLLDLPVEDIQLLASSGFNVTFGTLGTPYRVRQSIEFRALIGEATIPHHTEQEIVVADLSFELAEGPKGDPHSPDGEWDLWGKCSLGFLDPRVRSAILVQPAFDRIHSNGGVFIVFADARTELDVTFGKVQHGLFLNERPVSEDVWHLLSDLADMKVSSVHGVEMRPADVESPLVQLLGQHLTSGHFRCTLEGGYRHKNEWQTLAVNKFGDAVALARQSSDGGLTIVLPQIRDKAGFLLKLLTTVLPEFSPHLFPHIERGRWIHWPEYELPRVRDLEHQQGEIAERARLEIASLEEMIADARASNGWLHALLTGTDSELVDAVKMALQVLGFKKVVDVDVERDREGKSRREDLQIQDQSPTLILDIKGIGGFPSDADALQADKHAAIRMREQNRTDIVGVSIINHQRHLPPLDRDNAMPFRQELIDAATERTLGLMTTWDLYRLVNGLRKLAWLPEQVKPLFYRKGRIEHVPQHYAFVGLVVKAWTDKFGVVITEADLQIGDRIVLEYPTEFEETTIQSMRVNDRQVECASIGDPAGILWPHDRPRVREGMRVFRVRREQ